MRLATGTHHEILEALRGYSFSYAREEDLRDAVAVTLDAELPHVPIEQGVSLERGRADFVVGRTAVLVRTRGRAQHVLAEVERLLGDESIDSLVLVTNRAEDRVVSGHLAGKRLALLGLARVLGSAPTGGGEG